MRLKLLQVVGQRFSFLLCFQVVGGFWNGLGVTHFSQNYSNHLAHHMGEGEGK